MQQVVDNNIHLNVRRDQASSKSDQDTSSWHSGTKRHSADPRSCLPQYCFARFPYDTDKGTDDSCINLNGTAVYYGDGRSDCTLSGPDGAGKSISSTCLYAVLCKTEFSNYGDLGAVEMLEDAPFLRYRILPQLPAVSLIQPGQLVSKDRDDF
ncbi:hypothetical protein ACTFIU_009018 [Dictyostelium citrinum]